MADLSGDPDQPGRARTAIASELKGGLWRILRTPSLRSEIGWVMVHRVGQFALTLVALKLLTNLLGKGAFGEFSLALNAMMPLIVLLIMPAQNAYLRQFHRAEARGSSRGAGVFTMQWFAGATLLVVACTALLTVPLAGWLGLETLTVLGAGAVFFAQRWRHLGIQVMEIQRRRRACALHCIGWLAAQAGLVVVFVYAWDRSATAALFAYAAAAMLFAVLTVPRWMGKVLSQEDTQPSEMKHLLVSYGLPFGVLLALQWVQGFADRYVIAAQLDKEAVGLYVAAYQVCGAPYVFIWFFLQAMLVPIIFQRAKDADDPRQLWSADKILLGGVALYLVGGAALLLVYAFLGQTLLGLLTAKGYVLSPMVLVVLAFARYVQELGFLLQVFFAVHHQMRHTLLLRACGALITVPACWYGIKWYGIPGAALSVALAGVFYVGLLCFAPNGCFWMIRRNRRRLKDQIYAS